MKSVNVTEKTLEERKPVVLNFQLKADMAARLAPEPEMDEMPAAIQQQQQNEPLYVQESPYEGSLDSAQVLSPKNHIYWIVKNVFLGWGTAEAGPGTKPGCCRAALWR